MDLLLEIKHKKSLSFKFPLDNFKIENIFQINFTTLPADHALTATSKSHYNISQDVNSKIDVFM